MFLFQAAKTNIHGGEDDSGGKVVVVVGGVEKICDAV